MPGLLSQENRRALARGLLDTTQAASNSAASTVSAPVDALAWALRKFGAPIPQAPFGGSRGTGAGTSNFVVFPGHEGLLNILERNGKPIR